MSALFLSGRETADETVSCNRNVAGCSCCYVLSPYSRELESDLHYVDNRLAIGATSASRLEPHRRDHFADGSCQQWCMRVQHCERRHHRGAASRLGEDTLD